MAATEGGGGAAAAAGGGEETIERRESQPSPPLTSSGSSSSLSTSSSSSSSSSSSGCSSSGGGSSGGSGIGTLSRTGSSLSSGPLLARRGMIVRELLTTEDNYIQGLYSLLQDFIYPICRTEGIPTFNAHLARAPSSSSSSSSSPPPIPTRVPSFALLISAVEEIWTIHGDWFRELKSACALWSDTETCIGAVLSHLVPRLKAYVQFINNFSPAMKEINVLRKKHKKFDELLAGLKSAYSKLINGPSGLANLMITPIQRVPRYVLLFGDLKKNTETTHPDFEALQTVSVEIEQMTQHLDQEKEREEQNRRLQTLIKNLEGDLSHLRQSVMQLRQSQIHAVSKQRKAHAWKSKEFHSPRWCCFCHGAILDPPTGRFLGYHCKTCNVSAHKACLPKVPPLCGVVENDDFGGERTLLLESSKPVLYEAILALDRSGKPKKQLHCSLMLFDDALLCLEPRGSSARSQSRHNLICMIKWYSRLTKRYVDTLPHPSMPVLSILPPREVDVLHQFTFVDSADRDMWHSAIKEAVQLYISMSGLSSPSTPPTPASPASRIRGQGSMGTLPVRRRTGDKLPEKR